MAATKKKTTTPTAAATELADLVASSRTTKTNVIQLRMSDADFQMLQEIVEQSGAKAPAELLRALIRREHARVMGK